MLIPQDVKKIESLICGLDSSEFERLRLFSLVLCEMLEKEAWQHAAEMRGQACPVLGECVRARRRSV